MSNTPNPNAWFLPIAQRFHVFHVTVDPTVLAMSAVCKAQGSSVAGRGDSWMDLIDQQG